MGSRKLSVRADWELSYKSRIPTAKEWEDIREIFTELYHGDRSPCRRNLTEVRRIIAENHNFYANDGQYKYKIKKWKLGRYLNRKTVGTMIQLRDTRQTLEGKQTILKHNGVVVEDNELEYRRKRYKINSNSGVEVLEVIPSSISFSTPSPQSGNVVSDAPTGINHQSGNAVSYAPGEMNCQSDNDIHIIHDEDGGTVASDAPTGFNEQGDNGVVRSSLEDINYQGDNDVDTILEEVDDIWHFFRDYGILAGDIVYCGTCRSCYRSIMSEISEGSDIYDDDSEINYQSSSYHAVTVPGPQEATEIEEDGYSKAEGLESIDTFGIEEVDELLKNLNLGRSKSILGIMGTGWEHIEPEIMNKNAKVRGSVWMSSGWGGVSVIGSWIREDVVMSGRTPFGSDSHSVCTRDNHEYERGEDEGFSHLAAGEEDSNRSPLLKKPQLIGNLDSATFGRFR